MKTLRKSSWDKPPACQSDKPEACPSNTSAGLASSTEFPWACGQPKFMKTPSRADPLDRSLALDHISSRPTWASTADQWRSRNQTGSDSVEEPSGADPPPARHIFANSAGLPCARSVDSEAPANSHHGTCKRRSVYLKFSTNIRSLPGN
jgi:hypothetical protein